MGHIKLLPWRYTMLGFGSRNTSYGFLAGAAFLIAAGEQYYVFAAVCGGIALLMAYLKVQELEKDLDRAFRGQDDSERDRSFSEDIREIRRDIQDLHSRNASK